MSLRDDLEAMERHQENGTLKEWFEGTAPRLDAETVVSDPSTQPCKSTYHFVCLRGD